MNTPKNPFALTLQSEAARAIVLVGTDGGPPTEGGESEVWEVSTVTRSAGGNDLDHARFEYSLARSENRVQDMQVPRGLDTWLCVTLPRPRSEMDPEPLFAGTVAKFSARLDGEAESTPCTARVERHHFGAPVRGPRVVDPDESIKDLHTTIVFNPTIDGRVWGNRSSYGDPDEGHFWWIDPGSARTENARTTNGDQTANLWTLGQATVTLCRLANPTEDLILNPELEEVSEVLKDAPELKNWTLPRNAYLPDLLDKLLHAHGCDWFLVPVTTEDGIRLRIKLFKRGTGTAVSVQRERVGTDIQPGRNNLLALDCEWNVADIANFIRVQSAPKMKEVTVELKRGWSEDEDELTVDELKKSDPESEFAEHPNAWRRWVLNEAGDYADSRPTVDPERPWLEIKEGDWFDVRPLLDEADVPRRRKFERPLTFDPLTKERLNMQVEAWDPETDEWNHIGGWSALEHECGIYFDGDKPPDDLVALAEDARLRITACLVSDVRDEALAERREESPNGADIELVLDLGDRFFSRTRQKTGDYKSVLIVDPEDEEESDERDDHEALVEYAERVREAEDAARLTVSLTLKGIQTAYEIGQLVTRVDGRNIVLNRFGNQVAAKKYLQIVRVEFDFPRQETRLTVETFDDVKIQRQVL
jgi:hypothetical protein